VSRSILDLLAGAEPNPFDDLYIRGLAEAASTCFRSYDVRSSICRTCTLRPTCRAATFADLETLALFVDPTVSNSTAIRQHSLESIDEIIAGVTMLASSPSTCFLCGQLIAVGTHVLWVPQRGHSHDPCPRGSG